MAIPSGSLRAALLGGAIVIAILSYAIAPASADNGAKPSPAEKNIFDFGMDDPPAPPGELAKPLPPELKPPAQPGPPAVPPAAKPDATPAPAPSPPVAKPDKPAIPPRHRPAPPLPAPNPLPPLLRVAARKKVPPAAHAFLQSALKAASVRGDVMTLSEIVRVALISGDAEIARAAYQKMLPLLGPQSLRLHGAIIVSLQSALGDVANAKRSVEISGETNDSFLGLFQVGVARGQAATGDIAGALDTVVKMHSEYHRLTGLRSAAELGITAAGLEPVRKAFAAIGDEKIRGYGLGAVAAAQARLGDLSGARQTLDGIADIKGKSWGEYWVCQYQTMHGDFDGGLTTARFIGDRYQRANAIYAVAMELFGAGKVTQSIDAASSIDEVSRHDLALRALAVMQARAGDAAGGKQTLALCKTQAGAFHLAAQAKIEAATGDIAAAKATLAQIGNNPADQSQKGHAYLCIVRAQLRARDYAGAMATAKEVDGTGKPGYLSGNAIVAIAEALAAHRDYAGAKAAAQYSSQEIIRAWALSHIAVQQTALSGPAAAQETLKLIERPAYRQRGICMAAGIESSMNPAAAVRSINAWAAKLSDPSEAAWLYLGAAEGILGRPFDTNPTANELVDSVWN